VKPLGKQGYKGTDEVVATKPEDITTPTQKRPRRPLTGNVEALAIVDEMLNRYPDVTYTERGDAVGYSRFAISDYHKTKQNAEKLNP
jgi:hypothetical protein